MPTHFTKRIRGHACHLGINYHHNCMSTSIGYIQKSPSQIINLNQARQLFITFEHVQVPAHGSFISLECPIPLPVYWLPSWIQPVLHSVIFPMENNLFHEWMDHIWFIFLSLIVDVQQVFIELNWMFTELNSPKF